jgi:hypothetical protein
VKSTLNSADCLLRAQLLVLDLLHRIVSVIIDLFN